MNEHCKNALKYMKLLHLIVLFEDMYNKKIISGNTIACLSYISACLENVILSTYL